MTAGLKLIIEQQMLAFEPITLSDLNEVMLLNRVDQKYVMPLVKLLPLLKALTQDYYVLEINNQRISAYQTHYYDYPDYKLYLNHQNGLGNRFKIRNRTYLSNGKSYLEVKIKTNKGKTIKHRSQVQFSPSLTPENYNFIEQFVDLPKKNLQVSAENTFYRITLVSIKKTARITIDFDLKFTHKHRNFSLDQVAIIEIKRAKVTNDSNIVGVLKDLQVYPRGFSKYCMGMALLNDDLKQNKFKQNRLYLKKIENEPTVEC